ncbi:MAG: hypothetical protein U5P41_07110 [Gammaproteobacteria bacterium]|nr:hypothetical protein [Gammaproteobacteria bacterium]
MRLVRPQVGSYQSCERAEVIDVAAGLVAGLAGMSTSLGAQRFENGAVV